MSKIYKAHDVDAGADVTDEFSTLGKLLLDEGRIKPLDVERVLRLQKEEGLRFGEAAVKLELISEDELRHALAKQYAYPYVLPDGNEFGRDVIAAYKPFSKQVELLRAIRSHLMLRWFTQGHRAIAVVSPESGDGRSYLAANLAVVFSQLGQRTLLVDADLRVSKQHILFNIENEAGLSSMLADRVRGDVIVKIRSFPNLDVLPAGPEPPNPQELLGREKFMKLIDNFSTQYDVVLIDTPAIEKFTDGEIVAERVHGAMVLARLDKTRMKVMRELTNRLSATGVEVVGSVLNNF